MTVLNFSEGTVLRFRGIYGKNVHMGFVISKTQVMEMIEVNGICNVCITDINKPHPITNSIPSSGDWNLEKSAPRGWSLEDKTNQIRIKEAYEEFHGCKYNKIHKNCQHFAYKAVYGYEKSPDIEKIPKWLVDLGIAEIFAGASEASSDSQAALVREYAKEAKALIQVIQKGASLAGSMSSSTDMSKNFNGVIGSTSTLLNIIGNKPIESEQEELHKEKPDFFDVPTNGDIPNKIRELGELLNDGFITQEEFNKKKKELLSRL
ncbi:SHOCT domain-containing protein [Pseudanabaena sp. UWO310]|uniref:SHOCT domain-containing protein n=1 Tax=Pseudanabaena sp. UWO310 TaxID=2480795 RepID=UPI0011595AE8|nr:SHOCT domain-containing protein [Pseudanabaena sp. UWO310]TYQ30572.1 hypothetical protein PseudUWO310_08025 [Pseudanabaena sp. UWO310]